MSNSKKNPFSKPILFLTAIILLNTHTVQQLTAQSRVIGYSGRHIDLQLPSTSAPAYLKLTAVGGDGGKKRAQTKHRNVAGGRGAFVQATFKIGPGSNEIPPGAIIRFMVGQAGDSWEDGISSGSGGGGGTGIAFKVPYSDGPWTLLLVAGGGGGSWSDCCSVFHSGGPGAAYVAGKEGPGYTHRNNTDSPENYGGGAFPGPDSTDFGSFGGDGSFADFSTNVGWPGGPQTGSPTGSASNTYRSDYGNAVFGGSVRGGWGFGPGGPGDSAYGIAGGGGGFTGGHNGDVSNSISKDSGGGTSFVNEELSIGEIVTFEQGKTTSPADGYARYEYTETGVLSTVLRLAGKPAKCIDDDAAATNNNSNIQLFTCREQEAAQKWVVEGSRIRLTKNAGKCLNLDNSHTANGTNIQLFDCNGTGAQNWIYDVATRMIRSGIDFNKCLDVDHGILNDFKDGTNIQLWNCNGTDPQKWIIDGLPPAMPDQANLQLAMDPGKCIDVKDGRTANGTNIQLKTCNTTAARQFLFDGRRIKLKAAPTKCISPDPGSASDAPNVMLLECTSDNLQEWYYDGFTKAFRSAVNIDMCLDVDHSGTADGTNIQLYRCNGTDAQAFEIIQ